MLSLTEAQQAIVASAYKKPSWLFEVTTTDGDEYYWSTKTVAYDAQNYSFKIPPQGLAGITLNSAKSEHGLHVPNTLEFEVVNNLGPTKSTPGFFVNTDNTTFAETDGGQYVGLYPSLSDVPLILDPDDFIDADVLVKLVIANGFVPDDYLTGFFVNTDNTAFVDTTGGIFVEAYASAAAVPDSVSEEIIRQHKFIVKTPHALPNGIKLSCEDLLQKYLRGDYPKNGLLSDIFPAESAIVDDLCIPKIFGTAYLPLRAVYLSSDRRYPVGPSSLSYTYSEVRSPHKWNANYTTWAGPPTYTFSETTETDRHGDSWTCVQPLIDEGSVGVWNSGGSWLDMPCKYSNSETSAMTSPEDVIEYVIEDFGMPSAELNAASFSACGVTYTGWGLTFVGGFYMKEQRRSVLSRLLAMSHSTLDVEDTAKLRVLSKESKQTITDADILTAGQGQTSFRYNMVPKQGGDSGYVSWQETGKAQDKLLQTKVPCWTTSADPEKTTFQCDLVQDSQDAQRIEQLLLQRKIGKKASLSMTTKGTALALQPDDVITVQSRLYGKTQTALIDQMRINHDLSINLICSEFRSSLDDWEDLTPDAITVGT